jgi:hypothetical protein
MSEWDNPKFETMKGKTLTAITVSDDKERVDMVADDGKTYRLYHSQDCCEGVSVEDVCGDLADLIGSPLLVADEVESDKNPEGVTKEYQDSFTWTFYKLATDKGSVTIRWYGWSNGYYSESVSFTELS